MSKYLIIIFSFLLLSCTEKEPLYHSQSYVFGTLVDINIYGEPDQQAQMISSKIMQKFQQLHNDLHAWKPSELHSINRSLASGNTAHSTAETKYLLQQAQILAAQSNGLFNPAIGHLIALWGFQADEFKPINVDVNKLNEWLTANPQMSDLTIDKTTITSINTNVNLDLGGIAKGYALDQGLQILKEQGVKNALINIGGNVIALGQHGAKPWRVGIQHPRQPNAIGSLDLNSGWAIGTSGDYQRFFMLNGKRYCHIIDPRTGYPAQGTQSVTILIPPAPNAGLLSDVNSKPIFIASTTEKFQMANAMGVKDVMIIQENGDILMSHSMQARVNWLDPNAKQHIKSLQ
jgi:FAD:protein FMN transferase